MSQELAAVVVIGFCRCHGGPLLINFNRLPRLGLTVDSAVVDNGDGRRICPLANPTNSPDGGVKAEPNQRAQECSNRFNEGVGQVWVSAR